MENTPLEGSQFVDVNLEGAGFSVVDHGEDARDGPNVGLHRHVRPEERDQPDEEDAPVHVHDLVVPHVGSCGPEEEADRVEGLVGVPQHERLLRVAVRLLLGVKPIPPRVEQVEEPWDDGLDRAREKQTRRDVKKEKKKRGASRVRWQGFFLNAAWL